MTDVIIVAFIGIALIFLFITVLIKEIKREHLDEKRFVLKKSEGTLAKNYRIRATYGVLLGVIMGCGFYIYFRLSGKLENIFPDFLDYFGLK
ncbi:hypothetical protein [Ruminococcus flavefaciens]|jgi:hypothetical protein|uniref:hypothetical protein n=1 Tax=Ruminococcus flavefaciens TaxID=1265 RepID=UPI0013D97C57|nr:hypothetical protein [Ruminococcus flavefaciens]